jgi:AraC-like DNA-binding protein
MCGDMTDRLRSLIDLVVRSLDEPEADGRELAGRAHFSRDHLDRLLAAATGERPVALRRRLLLERAAWQLRTGAAPPSQVAVAAGYASLAAFSRAFARAHGVPPSRFAGSGRPVQLDAPNGVHFHPPAGLLVPGAGGSPGRHDLAERLVGHHLDRVRELLSAAAALPAEDLERPLRPGLVVVWFEGEEASAAVMAERLVFTLEVWVAAIAGAVHPEPSPAGTAPPALGRRFDAAARAFARIVRRIRDRGAWDDAFVDALCEPPQSFTYGGVVAHVLSYGAVRREALAGVLAELGVRGLSSGDPILWEGEPAVAQRRTREPEAGVSQPVPGYRPPMDQEQQKRFREAVDRKSEAAEQASKQPGRVNPQAGDKVTLDASGEMQPGIQTDDRSSQDTFSVRDKNSGKGKKTADKWNQ